jgi:hypothetical protein
MSGTPLAQLPGRYFEKDRLEMTEIESTAALRKTSSLLMPQQLFGALHV